MFELLKKTSGHYMTPTQSMHCCGNIPQNCHTLAWFDQFDPLQNGSLKTIPPICLSFKLKHAVTCQVHAKNTNVQIVGFIRLESGYFETATADVNSGARNVFFLKF